MADKLLIGSAPPADVTEFPPGTVWFQVWRLEGVANGAAKAVLGESDTDLLTAAGHGLVAGDPVKFSALTGGAGLAAGQIYYVLPTALTANDFKASATPGGAPVNFTTDVTAGQVTKQTMDGKSFKISIWSQMGVNAIDWGDSVRVGPLAFTAAPGGDKQYGRTDATHTYTGRAGSLYQLYFEVNGGLRRRYTVEAGEPVVIDDVSVQSNKRPHTPDNQTQVFAERGRLASSVRRQMGQMPPREGGRVN